MVSTRLACKLLIFATNGSYRCVRSRGVSRVSLPVYQVKAAGRILSAGLSDREGLLAQLHTGQPS